MKKIVILMILFFGLLASCSTTETENLMKSYFTKIRGDHDGWKNVIESSIQDTISHEELKRLFFTYNQTVPFERRDVVLIGRYFNISEDVLFEHELLLDKKNGLVGPFFLNMNMSKKELQALLKIENEIIAVLEKMEKEID